MESCAGSPSLALPRFHSKLQARRRRVAAQGKRPQFSSTPAASGHERTTAEELFESFLRGRQDTGDFISKASDKLWCSQLSDADMNSVRRKLAKIQKLENPALFEASSTMNQAYLARQKEKDELLRAGLLEYEALKREVSLMTVLVGLACGVYCVAVFSIEVAASYGLGVLGSLLYLQLLAYHVDKVSEDNVPHIFLERREGRRRIGITSKELQSWLEKNLQGVRLALLSPRLLIPTALYGVWLASKHQDTVNLQIAPMMLGFFAYKAAALIQAYRDNQGLLMTFPDDYAD